MLLIAEFQNGAASPMIYINGLVVPTWNIYSNNVVLCFRYSDNPSRRSTPSMTSKKSEYCVIRASSALNYENSAFHAGVLIKNEN